MADKKPVMDITKPGKAAATPTARPVIVGHGPVIKDPMVKDTGTAATATGDTSPKTSEADTPSKPANNDKVISQTGKTIAPLSETKADDKEEAVQETESDATPNTEDTDDAQSESSSEAIVDAIAEQADLDKKKSPEDAARKEQVQKLIDEKTYFLSIKQASEKSNNRWVVGLLLVVVILLVGLYLAVDAGVIKTSVRLPFHVFKQEQVDTTTATPVVATTAQTPAPASAPTASNSLQNYTDKTLGLSFDYPKDWGDITATPSTSLGTSGSVVQYTFSKQTQITAGMFSKDFKDTRQYVKAPCYKAGFSSYPAFSYPSTANALDNGVRVLDSASTYKVVEQLTGGLCNDKQLSGYVLFSKNKTYAGLEIRYEDKIKDSFDLAQRIADYKKDYNAYFSAELRDQIVAATKSVKEL